MSRQARWGVLAAWLGTALAALGLAACAGPDRSSEPETEWEIAFKGEAEDLDGLAAAVRDCGLGPATRHKDEEREWLDIELPRDTADKGGLACLIDWIQAHPGPKLGFISEPPEATGAPESDPAQAGPETVPITIAGKPEHLARFEQAARDCGLTVRHQNGTEELSIETPANPSPPLDAMACAFEWVGAHPEVKLYILGNAAPE